MNQNAEELKAIRITVFIYPASSESDISHGNTWSNGLSVCSLHALVSFSKNESTLALKVYIRDYTIDTSSLEVIM